MCVGRFPENVRPEFARNELDTDSGRIPWTIYRTTTPVEHEDILEFVRTRRRENALPRLNEAVAMLESIADVEGLQVPERVWKRLQSIVRQLKKGVAHEPAFTERVEHDAPVLAHATQEPAGVAADREPAAESSVG